MKFIVNKIPRWAKENIKMKNWDIDVDKYFVMTENTEEHIGFMKEKEDENGKHYFEIEIFDPEIEKEIMLYKHCNKRDN